MTQDEIISMAREAGFEVNYYKSLESKEVVSFDPIITYNLERFAALVAAPWIETNKALAKEIIELKKQAEQDPVGYIDAADLRELCNGNERQYSLFSEDKGRMVAIYAAPVSIAKQSETDSSSSSMRTTVRTKYPCNPLQDLTDDEIWEALEMHSSDVVKAIRSLITNRISKQVDITDEEIIDLRGEYECDYDFARAVIAADREKNK